MKWSRYPVISADDFARFSGEVNSRADVKVAARLVLVDGVSANKAAQRCRLAQVTVSYCCRGILEARKKEEARVEALRKRMDGVSQFEGREVEIEDGVVGRLLAFTAGQAVVEREDGWLVLVEVGDVRFVS